MKSPLFELMVSPETFRQGHVSGQNSQWREMVNGLGRLSIDKRVKHAENLIQSAYEMIYELTTYPALGNMRVSRKLHDYKTGKPVTTWRMPHSPSVMGDNYLHIIRHTLGSTDQDFAYELFVSDKAEFDPEEHVSIPENAAPMNPNFNRYLKLGGLCIGEGNLADQQQVSKSRDARLIAPLHDFHETLENIYTMGEIALPDLFYEGYQRAITSRVRRIY